MTYASNLSSLALAAILLGSTSISTLSASPQMQLAQAAPEDEQADPPPANEEGPADLGELGREDGAEIPETGADAPDAPPAPAPEEQAPPVGSEPPPPPAEPEPTPEPAAPPPPASDETPEPEAPPPAPEPEAAPEAPRVDEAPPAQDPPAPAPDAPPAPAPEAVPPPKADEPPQPDTQQTPEAAPKAAPKDGARPRRDREDGPREGRAPEAAPAPSEVKDLKELREERKERSEDGGKRVVIEEPDNRVIVREGGRSIIRADEGERFRRLGGKQRREKRDGLDITVNVRPGGIEIFTENDDRGRPLRRYRRDREGREVILFDNRDYYRRHRDGSFTDAIVDLPPPRLTIPRRTYVVDYEEASYEDVYDALSAPPVERLERTYSLEEVRRSPNLRARMRRIDLDVINFDFGAWGVAPSQYPALERIADAMNRVIDRNPDEMFLVEGHTDAVGSDEDNLSLSDRRAETVAIILTDEFGVPPENIATQGYGEHYLKINTQAAERQNRRVAVRRITPLISRGN